VQLTSVPDYLEWDFVGERARGIFELKRKNELRPEFYERTQVAKAIAKRAQGSSPNKVKKVLNQQYRKLVKEYMGRFHKFVANLRPYVAQTEIETSFLVAQRYLKKHA